MGRLFDRIKLEFNHVKVNRELDLVEKKRLKKVKLEEQFQNEKNNLEKRVHIEILKAKVRKTQGIASGAKGQAIQKSAFEKFQDFATNFAQNQRSIVGDTKIVNLNKSNKKSGRI